MIKEDLVIVKGLQLWGTHGNFPEENKLGQKFVVDVEVSYDMMEMCLTDNLDAGLSYSTVYKIAKKIVTTEQHKLLQRIAQRIAEDIIKAYPIKQVKVTVKKPCVPIGGILDYTAVSIVREPKDITG
ncbi:MAG: dihydroneopterin aldolase [Candidatus Ranarchaeia archaeon]